MMYYKSEDIFLRPLERNDALTSCQWRNDPEVWKYTGSRPDRHITPEIELEWIDKVLSDNSRRVYAICLKKDGRYVGNTQVTNIENNEAEFHIFIGDREVWGKGIGAIASEKMLKIAKDELHLNRLRLWVNQENIAAKKIYQKIGFLPVDNTGNMAVSL